MLAPLLLTVLAQPSAPTEEAEKIDAVQVIRGQSAWELQWADAEDRVQGTSRPLDPIAEKPIELSVRVGTFEGADFDGPVTVTMRCPEWHETKTVVRGKDERAWFAKFEPASGGDCTVDLGFKSSRHKLLHFKMHVLDAPLSRLPWYVILAVILLLSFGLGLRAIFKKPEST